MWPVTADPLRFRSPAAAQRAAYCLAALPPRARATVTPDENAQARMAALRAFRRKKRTRQQRALLELKASTDAAFSQLVAQNERSQRRKAKQAAAEKLEAKAILQAGGNPYVVSRKRKQARRRAAEERRLVEARRRGEVRIAATLLEEQCRQLKQAQKQRSQSAARQRGAGRPGRRPREGLQGAAAAVAARAKPAAAGRLPEAVEAFLRSSSG